MNGLAPVWNVRQFNRSKRHHGLYRRKECPLILSLALGFNGLHGAGFLVLVFSFVAEMIDHTRAESILAKAWSAGDAIKPPARMANLIQVILGATDITFKYLLVTGYLAKCVNPRIHARALQAGSKLQGAYDARSLCHGVIVGFEKSKGNLFGLSNEPFLNKPARHPEHDGANTQIRNKVLSRALHDALELANTSKPDEIFAGLVQILQIGKKRMSELKTAEITAKVNLLQTMNFIQEFLKETDGGARLVSVWGAFVQLLSEEAEIKVYSPNASDFFGKTSGDVEAYYEKTLVSAAECKQRPLTHDDVKHGIKKALEKGVPQYDFVYSVGIAEGHKDAILATLTESLPKVDIGLIEFPRDAASLVKILNPKRRAVFGETVVTLLREMRKFESANLAAELWNKLKE